jgi:hypothetical protein
MAEVFREPLTAECMAMYVESLADVSDDQIRVSIGRVVRELKWFPKPAEIRELAGANPAKQDDAEARKAWDILIAFIRKYVGNDVYGNYGPEHGWYPTDHPQLSDRILDTVRRTGGWKVYARMTHEDFPFIQKRFMGEFESWSAVEQIPVSKLLKETPCLQLVVKPINPPKPQPSSCLPGPAGTSAVKPNPAPYPMTDAQIRDRREMLKQQAASLAKGTRFKCEPTKLSEAVKKHRRTSN